MLVEGFPSVKYTELYTEVRAWPVRVQNAGFCRVITSDHSRYEWTVLFIMSVF